MTTAERLMALKAIGLIIEYYLPSIRGHGFGGGEHSLDIWEKIRAEIEWKLEKEGQA
jgi:hypothetical protein